MSTDKLKEALLRQKTGLEAKNVIDALAKLLEIDYAVALRFAYAIQRMQDEAGKSSWLSKEFCKARDNDLDPTLRQALDHAVHELAVRHEIAAAIDQKSTVLVKVSALIPEKEADKMCIGCPMRLECLSESLHQPIECYTHLRYSVPVYPIRIKNDVVELEANQPRGTYKVPLKVFK